MSDGQSDLDEWDRLLSEQTALFKKTTVRNKLLEARVEELERELSVWKIAMKANDEEKETLQKQVVKLERSIGSLKDDNPLILCLIDGDGNIFTPELIQDGRAGGRHAAMLLTKGLTGYMSTIDGASAGRGQVWLTIYCNKKGLTDTLASNHVCTAEEFDDFIMGFNQASPLFSFVDVGVGKEAADSKIKECLRVFTRFPQTSRVFFGGAHDNGYTSTLNYLQNEGLHNKLTILRGYKDLANELKSLNFPHLEIEGVFMTRKLQNLNLHKKNGTPGSPAPSQNLNLASSSMVTPPPPQYDSGEKMRNRQEFQVQKQTFPQQQTQGPVLRFLTPNLPLHKHRPPPCNFHYLSECVNGTKCRFAHDYVLLPDHVAELRKNASKWPCPFANAGKYCPYGSSCCMAHMCLKGPDCSFAKAKKCKFTGKGMHGTRNRNTPDRDAPEGSQSNHRTPPPPTSVRSTSPTGSSYAYGSWSNLSPATSPVKREFHGDIG